jgi:hypothetical protein
MDRTFAVDGGEPEHADDGANLQGEGGDDECGYSGRPVVEGVYSQLKNN